MGPPTPFSRVPPRPPRASFPSVLQKFAGRTVGQVASGSIAAVELQLEPVKTKGLFMLPWECLSPLLCDVTLPHAKPGQPPPYCSDS